MVPGHVDWEGYCKVERSWSIEDHGCLIVISPVATRRIGQRGEGLSCGVKILLT